MTAIYDQPGISYDAVTWSYDGTELNLGPYDPTVFLDAEGPYITSYAASGSLALLSATGRLSSFTAAGVFPPDLHATGTLRGHAATGTLMVYEATGVMEHGDGS